MYITSTSFHQLPHPCRTTCDMAYEMLLRWCERKEKGGSDAGGAKQTLVRVLESLECEKSAEYLRVGEQKSW